jgi:putative effector of murein hydrolase
VAHRHARRLSGGRSDLCEDRPASARQPSSACDLVYRHTASRNRNALSDVFRRRTFIHFLLGPAIVALAVPLYEHRDTVARAAVPMLVALLVGSIVAMGSAILIARAFGAPRAVLIALAPKSVTAGVAMGITEALGGDPALTAVLVILTGIIGAVVVTPLMNGIRLRDFRARGFAVGLASHGIGTARAFQVDQVAGTFAGIAMGLNALLTAILVPFVLALLVR